MCIIIDNDVVHRLCRADDLDGAAVRNWLIAGGRAVAGGKLLREYRERRKQHEILILLNELSRSGRLHYAPCDAVDMEAEKITKMNISTSNDAHIIALARVSGARGLWTGDHDLVADFKDGKLLNSPRGKVLLSPTANDRQRKMGMDAITGACRKRVKL